VAFEIFFGVFMRLKLDHAAKFAAAAFAVAGALVAFTPDANALSYTTSGLAAPLTGLGSQFTPTSPYDQLQVQGQTGNFADNTTINLNYLTFTAGVNAYVPAVNSYSFSETLSLSDGSGVNLSIPFNVSINYSDNLTIVGGTTFSFTDTLGTLWQVVLNGLTIGPNSGGSMSDYLTAQVTDPPGGVSQAPLPAALPLFASGLFGMGLFARRKKRKNATAIAAA
jgi:hypothetical protein